jgi:hypothetical protein
MNAVDILKPSERAYKKIVNKFVVLKVHKRENFLGSDIEICTFS